MRMRVRVDIPPSVGGRIRWEREMVGLTQTRLALLAGLTKQALSEIEADRQRVTAAELIRLALVLQVSTDRLCGRFPSAHSAAA